MPFKIESARRVELREAIREHLSNRNQSTRFEQVIKEIIDETIFNLNNQTREDEQAPDLMMGTDEGSPSYFKQDNQLLRQFVIDEKANLENSLDYNTKAMWKPNSLQFSERIREELKSSSDFDKLDLGSRTHFDTQRISRMVNTRESEINTVNEIKPMPIDRPKKIKDNLTDDNIYIDEATGSGYQIIYQGKAIDKDCLQQITEEKTHKTKRGWFLCKIHDECNFSKPPEIDKSIPQIRFNANSVRHIRTSLVKYFCRACLHRFSYSMSPVTHLREHSKGTNMPTPRKSRGKGKTKRVTPECMAPHPKLSLMDYQGKYKLQLTDENMQTMFTTGYKYQIYYEGQAISKDRLKRIMEKKVIKSKSGYFLCPLHEDCPYSRASSSMKGKYLFNQDALTHTGAAFITYLCRHCFHKFNRLCAMRAHLKIHYNP